MEILNPLGYSLLKADVVGNALDTLVLSVIAGFDIGLLRDQLYDLKLLNLLLVVRKNYLNIIPGIDEIILLDHLRVLIHLVILFQVDLRYSQAIVVPYLLEDVVVNSTVFLAA